MRLMLLVVFLVSCSPAQHSPDATETSVTGSTGESPGSDVSLPLDWINVEYSRVSFAVGRAEALLAVACMERKGFQIDTAGLFTVEPGRYTIDRRYATYSPSIARTRGYQPEANNPDDHRQLPVPDAPEQRPAFLLALTGADDGLPHDFQALVDAAGVPIGQVAVPQGCQAEAMTQLYGGLKEYAGYRQDDLYIQGIVSQTQTAALADPNVVATQTAWAECMARLGYQYQQPSDPQFADWPEPRPGRAEVETAVADMTCREQVKYLQVLASAERQAQNDLLRNDGTRLNEILTRRNLVVSRAKAVAATRT